MAGRLVGLAVALGIGGPIVAGLGFTLLAGFGWMPAIGRTGLGTAPWAAAFAAPGFATGLRLTLWTGLGATALSLGLALALAQGLAHDGGRRMRLIAPLLAVPHAALAIGLAFLIAPSGWIVRLVSPWATGWTTPPAFATTGDPAGLALILGLALKEVPFLMLITLAALSRVPVAAHMAAGRALGHSPASVWVRVIVPQLYPLIRLPVYVVLAFSLSVVDMALILGPSNPPTLSVWILRGYMAPDPAMALPASAAAVMQLGIVACGIGLWHLAERILARIGRAELRRGRRGGVLPQGAVRLAGALGAGLAGGSLLVLMLWSLAWRWPFPAALPETWSLRHWTGRGWGAATLETLWIGVAAVALGALLAIAWLEAEDRAGRRLPLAALVAAPLLIPQIGFLQGLNIAFLHLGLPPGRGTVIWAHLIFVFPYMLLALSGPWRALEPGLIRSAAALGAGPWRRLLAVKLPVLLRPILTAAAIGFSVSVAQYVPTLFMGAGRIATLTTEAVALSSSADRRVVGVYAVLQAILPLAAFMLAIAVPGALHRNRRALAGELTR
ncbi:MAG: ABC transporter permease subunit [Paracoccaceae bacterium]